jgi:hypothetical protein
MLDGDVTAIRDFLGCFWVDWSIGEGEMGGEMGWGWGGSVSEERGCKPLLHRGALGWLTNSDQACENNHPDPDGILKTISRSPFIRGLVRLMIFSRGTGWRVVLPFRGLCGARGGR